MQKRIIANYILIPEIARLVSDGSKIIFTPKGVSMLPFIRGDMDNVVLVKPKGLRIGDIVLARNAPDTYVLHRIIEINGEDIVLMGDGNIVSTERCRVSDILAIAEKIIRNGKEIDCRSKSHLRKADIWRKLKPIRRYLLAIYKRVIL